jgi:hypothetical protein
MSAGVFWVAPIRCWHLARSQAAVSILFPCDYTDERQSHHKSFILCKNDGELMDAVVNWAVRECYRIADMLIPDGARI